LVLEQLKAAVKVAQAERNTTDETLAEIQAKAKAAIRSVVSSGMVDATADLTPEEHALRALAAGTDPLQVSLKAAQFGNATADLKKADKDLADLQEGPDPLELSVRQRDMLWARAAWQEAVEDLVELTKDIDPLETQRLRSLAAVAKAAYNDAVTLLMAVQERLPMEVDLLKANVALSQEVAKDALEDYEGAILRSPFAGVISLVNVELDDEVTHDSRIIEVVDPTILEVAGFVDATNANLISTGDRAEVTIDNLPGDIFPSAVTFISDKPRTERGIVSFPITITVDVPAGADIPLGLSSVSVVITPNEKGLLLAPQGTVQGSAWRPLF
jgi:multidrug resistance efflux pump